MGEPFWSCDATLAKIVDRFREMHRTSGDVGSAEAKMVLTEKDVAASSSGSGAKDRGEGGDGGGRPSPGDEKKKKRKPAGGVSSGRRRATRSSAPGLGGGDGPRSKRLGERAHRPAR